MTRPHTLEECVERHLEKHFRDLDGAAAHGVYDMMVSAVERPLLEVVMRQAQNNQTRASAMLGIDRNTLRKKLARHGLLE